MTIDDSDVRGVLHRATDHLTSPPGLLDDVRRGGRRRVVRRRSILAAALAVAVAAPVGGVLRFAGDDNRGDVASPLFDQPTRGDLAGDAAYLRQVREVWRRRLDADGDHPAFSGEPQVVWAGRTPAGPAAYVVQRTAEHPIVSTPENDRLVAMLGFVEPTADGPRVMTTLEGVSDAGTDGNSQAALLGPDRNVLLVIDVGQPVVYSSDMGYTADGRITRTFQPVPFRDGAAVLRVPPQRRTKVTVALSRTPVSLANTVHITNVMEILFPSGNSPIPPELSHLLPGGERVWGPDPTKGETDRSTPGADPLAAYVDMVGYHTNDRSPLLNVYGVTPDGRRLRMHTIQYDDDPARVIAMLAAGDGTDKVVASGFVNRNGPLPVRLRLPDGQGVLVAAEGATLGYRLGAGQWQDAGRDAALLPAAATEVRVTRAGGATTVVAVP